MTNDIFCEMERRRVPRSGGVALAIEKRFEFLKATVPTRETYPFHAASQLIESPFIINAFNNGPRVFAPLVFPALHMFRAARRARWRAASNVIVLPSPLAAVASVYHMTSHAKRLKHSQFQLEICQTAERRH